MLTLERPCVHLTWKWEGEGERLGDRVPMGGHTRMIGAPGGMRSSESASILHLASSHRHTESIQDQG